VANRPFLLYQIDLLKSAGLDEIILSLSYQPRKIEDLLKDGADYDVLIRYALESSPLGTAGAFRNAEEWIDSPTVVFNGDVLTGLDLKDVIRAHEAKQAIATIVLTPVEDPSAYGLVEFDEDGRIRRFLEKPGRDEITTNNINAGTYVLSPEVLEHIPADRPFSFERELFPSLLQQGLPVYAYVSDCYWIDIGSPAKYLEVHRDIMDGRFTSSGIPASGIPASIADADRGGKVDARSIISDGVTIGSGARIESSVVGANCRIEADAHVANSVIWSGNTIDEGARVRGSILGRGCYVGRHAVLEDTVLGGKSSITDFSSL
jgi:NDP-sugar pyrophosphorylase family protein